MMADSDYSGTTKPLQRARHDEARRSAEPETTELEVLRKNWLLAENARLVEHRAQLLPASGAACAFCGQEIYDGVADPVGTTGVGSLGVKHDRSDDDFQRVNARGSVLQSLNLFFGHALSLLRLRKPKQAVDSTQGKPAKEAA